jgi:hypothetical protein
MVSQASKSQSLVRPQRSKTSARMAKETSRLWKAAPANLAGTRTVSSWVGFALQDFIAGVRCDLPLCKNSSHLRIGKLSAIMKQNRLHTA